MPLYQNSDPQRHKHDLKEYSLGNFGFDGHQTFPIRFKKKLKKKCESLTSRFH